MLQLELGGLPMTIQADRFKVIMSGKQVKVVDINTNESTVINAKAFKANGAPDMLPFDMLPDIFDQDYLANLAEHNRMGLERDHISGYIASWRRKGMLTNNKGIFTKTKVVSL